MAIIDAGAGTTEQLTGLTPSTAYTVRVRAYDAAGNRSGWTATQGFSTAAGSTTRTVTVGAVTSTTATGLTPASGYTARIRARDAAGNWSAWTSTVPFTTGAAGPTVTPGRARPVVRSGTVVLDVTATPPGGQTITGHSWAIQGGAGGSLTSASTATPTYTAPSSGAGLVTIRDTVTASGGGTAVADVTVSYGPTIVAAENALTGTARATWDLASPNFGGVSTLQGFADGFTVDKTGTVNFKIAQSDTAGWSAEVFRLGWYNGDGARSYGTLAPNGTQLTASQSQPAPVDADPDTTLISADCAAWATTLTWTPPAWAPSGIYVLRLNRTGGGASHVMFVLRDDARAADLMLMPSDSTWNAYNAWGGMGSGQYAGNSLYFGTAVNQYHSDCARYVSYNRPVINRGASDSGRTYGAVTWSNFFTGEYPMVRFVERNGVDVKYYGCIDAAGDSTGTHLRGGSGRAAVKAAMFVGHNEYWSDAMRAGWETAKANGVSVFSCAGNEVFWRTVGSSADSAGRPRVQECYKSTIASRGSTGRTQWTGSWRDPDGAGKGGNQPENTLTGTIFCVNGPDLRSLTVPFSGGYSAQPLWRHTEVAALASGSWTSPSQILGFEWDTYGPAGVSTTAAAYMAAPHAQARYCSTVTHSVSSGLLLTDAGDVYDAAGTATHRLVVHPGGGTSIAFGTGTVNWALGVDNANTYQQGSDNTSLVLQQATVNMLADMGAAATTLMPGLTQPTPVTWFVTATPATARSSAVAATRTTAAKIARVTARASAAAATQVRTAKIRAAVGRTSATATSRAGLRKALAVAARTSAAALSAAVTGIGATRPVAARSSATAVTSAATRRTSQAVARATAAAGTRAAATSGTAAPATGRTAAIAATGVSALRSTASTARATAAVAPRVLTGRRTAATSATCAVAATRASAAKRATGTGRTTAAAISSVTAAQPGAPRAVSARCLAIALTHMRRSGRTTPRPNTGTTARPYAGVTPRP